MVARRTPRVEDRSEHHRAPQTRRLERRGDSPSRGPEGIAAAPGSRARLGWPRARRATSVRCRSRQSGCAPPAGPRSRRSRRRSCRRLCCRYGTLLGGRRIGGASVVDSQGRLAVHAPTWPEGCMNLSPR
eukprot:458903-Prymnesium_polylepis.1